MAVRLQMKLGVVAEHDRLPDSPDTLVVVEPSVGSVARSKGHLYLLVTSRQLAPRARGDPARRRDDPQRVLLRRVGGHPGLPPEGDRAPPTSGWPTSATARAQARPDGNGPIGIGVAVVRGNELYVATVGPAEAYLIRQARLSTLPDPHRERGLPSPTSSPTSGAARSRSATRSSSSRPTSSPGWAPTSSRTRWSRSTRSRRWSTSTTGSWPPTGRQRRRDRVRGDRGRADTEGPDAGPGPPGGAAGRRPRPLAHPARRQRAGRRVGRDAAPPGTPRPRPAARSSASSAASRTSCRGASRPTAGSPRWPSRRETQRRGRDRRARLVVVVGGLGLGVYAFGGNAHRAGDQLGRRRARRLDQARGEPRQGSGPGIDLIATTRTEGARAADRRRTSARRRGRRQGSPPRRHRRRSATRSSPGSTGSTAWSRSLDPLFRSPEEGARPSTSARWSAARTARRTSRPRRRRPSTASTSSASGGAVGRPRRQKAQRRRRSRAALPGASAAGTC